MDKLDLILEELRNMKVVLENEIRPQMQTLAEGQQTILEKLTPVDRVEELENDVTAVKLAIKTLSREISELKKAQ